MLDKVVVAHYGYILNRGKEEEKKLEKRNVQRGMVDGGRNNRVYLWK